MKRNLVAIFFLLSFSRIYAQENISLQEVIGLALEHNYDVRIEKTFTESATTDGNYVNAAFIPQLNATAAVVRNVNDQELRFPNELRKGKPESQNTTASLQLNWTLFDGTRMFATRSRIIATEEQSEFLLKEQMVGTIAMVIQNYYDIVRQKQQLKALREQMAVSDERVKLAERKFQVGTGAKPELLQAKVDYNAQRAQALQQEALIIQLKEQLNASVDRKLPSPYEVADTIEIDLGLTKEDMLENLENSNYGLRAARTGLTIADRAVWEQRALGAPSLDFGASYNYNKLDNIVLVNPFGPAYSLTQGFNVGLTLNIPILNNFNNRRLIQQAKIFENRQQLIFNQQKVNVNTALLNAFTNYENARRILIVEEENILLAKENVSIALEVFKRGASTFVELRTAQQSLLEAYTRLINVRYLAKVAETELLRLNGSLLQ